MITTLISLPYEIARRPVVAVGGGLTGLLPESAPPRVAFEKAVGSADQLAGLLLRNGEIAQRGADRLERSARLAAAAKLERKAATKKANARDTLEAGHEKAERERERAEETLVEGLEEADAVELQAKRDARAAARKAAAEKKTAADREASAKRSSAQQRRTRTARSAAAQEKTAQHRASAEIKEARENQQAAAEARKDADRLEELTETKKTERKQS